MDEKLRQQLQVLLDSAQQEQSLKDLGAKLKILFAGLSSQEKKDQKKYILEVMYPALGIEAEEKQDDAKKLLVALLTIAYINAVPNSLSDEYIRERLLDLTSRVVRAMDGDPTKFSDEANRAINRLMSYTNTGIRNEVANAEREKTVAKYGKEKLYRVVARVNTDGECLALARETASGVPIEYIQDRLPVHPNCVCMIEPVL